MKKITFLTAMFCLCFQTVAVVFAATPNFAGNWELDVSRSKLPDTMQIESMTLTVLQTEKDLSVQSATKRARNGMGSPMRRGDGGNQMVIYSLEGKEINAEIGSGTMAGKETRKASVTSDGKLSLTIMRSFNNETGAVTLKTNDTWELMDEGKTLKVIRYMETPRGATNAELYFTKKDSVTTSPTATAEDNKVYRGAATSGTNKMPKMISAGVVNGKATSLPKPPYPAEVRATGASGAVNVKVIVDEAGNVISAEAVSGDVLLRDICVEAAKKAKFAPTRLSGEPVRFTGVLVYNFVP